jgi:hypothetical protein
MNYEEESYREMEAQWQYEQAMADQAAAQAEDEAKELREYAISLLEEFYGKPYENTLEQDNTISLAEYIIEKVTLNLKQ